MGDRGGAEEREWERTHTQEMVDDTPPAGREDEVETEGCKRRLRRDAALLVSTVEANQQIDEQKKLQQQQDKEAEAVRAKLEVEANLRGQRGKSRGNGTT